MPYRDICKPQFLHHMQRLAALYSKDVLSRKPGLNGLTETGKEEPSSNRP
jgi:hypothetical protein